MEIQSPTKDGRCAAGNGDSANGGFTLPEIIVGIVLLGAFMLMCVGLVQAAQRLLPGRAITLDGVVIPLAPSPAAFADSVKLHSVLLEWLNHARAVYVLGGSHQGLPTGASRAAAAPLALSRLPTIPRFDAGLPLDAFAFYQTYATQLGLPASSYSPRDFTVMVVGPWNGQLVLTVLVQVKEREVVLDDQTRWVRRETKLYDVSGETWSCAFLEKASAASSVNVGARHYWYRYFEDRVAEEGPVMAVFPDPCVYAGSRGRTDEPPPFSRFTYVLAVNP